MRKVIGKRYEEKLGGIGEERIMQEFEVKTIIMDWFKKRGYTVEDKFNSC